MVRVRLSNGVDVEIRLDRRTASVMVRLPDPYARFLNKMLQSYVEKYGDEKIGYEKLASLLYTALTTIVALMYHASN